MKNKQAFTLLEVMLICIIITSFLITLPINKRQTCDKKVNDFYQMYSADLNYSISYSLTHLSIVQLRTTSYQYYYLSHDAKKVFERQIDQELTLKLFNVNISNGFVREQVNFNISCQGKTYSFIVVQRSGVVRRV